MCFSLGSLSVLAPSHEFDFSVHALEHPPTRWIDARVPKRSMLGEIDLVELGSRRLSARLCNFLTILDQERLFNGEVPPQKF